MTLEMQEMSPKNTPLVDACLKQGKITPEQLCVLRAAFDKIDVDKSGDLSVEEVSEVLKALHIYQGDELRKATKFIKQIDVDTDGHITFDEFCRALTAYDAKDTNNSMLARVVVASAPNLAKDFYRMQAIVEDDIDVWSKSSCFGLKWTRMDTYHWWVKSYYADWAWCAMYLIIGAIMHFTVKPYVRVGPLGNASLESDPTTTSGTMNSFAIDKPHRKDTVTVPLLMGGTLVVPPICVIVLQQFFLRSLHDMHHFALALATSFAMAFCILEGIKLSAGRLRPDYLARIQQYGNGVDDLDIKDVLEAHLSFPSGHSALSALGGTLFSLYCAGKTGMFQSGGGQAWKVFLFLIPQFAAWGTAVSRTRDYRHNFSDVVAGYLFGVGFAWLNYTAHFHPLSSSLSFYPKSRELELLATRPGYKIGDSTLRLQMLATMQGSKMSNVPSAIFVSQQTKSTTDAVSDVMDSYKIHRHDTFKNIHVTAQ